MSEHIDYEKIVKDIKEKNKPLLDEFIAHLKANGMSLKTTQIILIFLQSILFIMNHINHYMK
jgi:hypothetical protein